MVIDKEQYKQLLQIAQLYYEENKTQSEIAKIINIHRSSISRMLKMIRELGMVSISINHDLFMETSLENSIKQNFKLKDVVVIPVSQDLDAETKNNIVSEVAAKYVTKYIKHNHRIGVSWGRTLCHLVENLKLEQHKFDNIEVIPMIGGPSGRFAAKYHVNTIAHGLANKLGGKALLIDYPAIVGTSTMAQEIFNSQHIKDLKKWWGKLDVAIFSLGSPSVAKHYIWHEFYGNLFDTVTNPNIVGDIVSRFYDVQGQEIPSLFQKNIIGIELNTFYKIPLKICVVGDLDKLHSVQGALNNGNIIDILIISNEIADRLHL